MKGIVLIMDGMGDRPIKELGNKINEIIDYINKGDKE
mgnify:CR=1 FL=1